MNEIDIIRSRICLDFSTSINPSLLEGNALLEYAESTAYDEVGLCYFRDLDYSFENRGAWGAKIAVCRIMELLQLYLNLQDEGKRSLAKKLFLEHLHAFSIKKYSNLNWWYNDIGLPRVLGPILLLVGNELPEEVYLGLFEMLERGVIRVHGEILTCVDDQHQGANLLWYCENSIYHAVLTNDEEELSLASEALCKETYGREDTGLQGDGSFFQHGRFLYSMGYGLSYFEVLSRLTYYLATTQFALTKEATENILCHLLDGMRYMTYGRGIDYLTLGREYTREGVLNNSRLYDSVKYISKTNDISRQNEVSAFENCLKRQCGCSVGSKYFDIAHYLVLQNDYVHIAYRTLGEGMVCAEICNRENVLGFNLAYGTNTCVMRSGDEYFNIAPLWKYDYMPGTTTSEETDDELLAHPDFDPYLPKLVNYYPEIFVSNGKTIDDISVAVYACAHNGTYQKSSAVATKYGMIFLGSDIYNKEGRALHTTLEQCNLLSTVVLNDSRDTLTHQDICYINHDAKNPLKYSIEHRVGDWQRNRLYAKSKMHEGDVLSVFIEHTAQVSSYAYEILPLEYISMKSTVIMCNEKLHAVRIADGREIYIFFDDYAYSDSIFGKNGDIVIVS